MIFWILRLNAFFMGLDLINQSGGVSCFISRLKPSIIQEMVSILNIETQMLEYILFYFGILLLLLEFEDLSSSLVPITQEWV